MTDTAKPKNGQTVLLPVPNGLIRGDLKPDVFVCWIFLAWDMGSLDYADRSWESLQWLFSIGRDTELSRKQAQRIIKSLEDSGWLSTEKIRDGVRIYLFPSNDAPEEHLGAIKDRVSYFRMYHQTTKQRCNALPYRVKHMTENGNFTRIPVLVVEDPRFTRTDKGVYAVIRSYVNAQYGRSIETMAKEINITKSPAEKSLKKWKGAGYIVYDGRRRVVNQYEFNDSPGHQERIRGHEECISSAQLDMTNAIETRNIKTSNQPSNLRSEATGYQGQEILGETKGMAPGSTETLRASVSLSGSLVNASARCASAPVSSGEGNSAVMHSIPAHRGTEKSVRGEVVYETKAQRDARAKRALQDKLKRQIARENAQKGENTNV